jgi:hypothetical protein
MRRALRANLPALAHWFPGEDWSRVDEMPYGLIDAYLTELRRIADRLNTPAS